MHVAERHVATVQAVEALPLVAEIDFSGGKDLAEDGEAVPWHLGRRRPGHGRGANEHHIGSFGPGENGSAHSDELVGIEIWPGRG